MNLPTPTQHFGVCTPLPDVELGRARTTPIRYDLAWPGGPLPASQRGLVVVIPGFGQDNDDGYLRSLRHWIAQRFGLACVSVHYHGVRCRPHLGAATRFNTTDAARLYQACQDHGIDWPAPPRMPDPAVLMNALKQTRLRLETQPTPQATPPVTLTLSCGLFPPDGPVNLGLPQALDQLAVLHQLQREYPIDPDNLIALGSSHGGYLAQLCAKLRPGCFRAVLDNSGYASLPRRYVNSRESDAPDYIEAYTATMRMAFFVESAWTFDDKQPNHYHAAAAALRDLTHRPHLDAMREAADRRTVYRCVHAPDDPIAPTLDKQHWRDAMKHAGFDATLRVMSPGDVDGKYVKSLDHGMGLSLRTFFAQEYEALPPVQSSRPHDPAEKVACVTFPAGGWEYRLSYDPLSPIQVQCNPTE